MKTLEPTAEKGFQKPSILGLTFVCALLLLVSPFDVTTAAFAETLISETFSGKESTNLVGTTTPDGFEWTGAKVSKQDSAVDADEQNESVEKENTDMVPKFAIRQDGSTSGDTFTAYHKFKLIQGKIFSLEAELSPTNKFDNQWFTIGFAVKATDGKSAPQLEGGTTYGQTVLSGSGYRYGWIGPNTKEMCELHGPGLHKARVKVILDTSNPSDYTIELFNGEGQSIHGPSPIGTPPISQVFIGSSGTNGRVVSFKLSASNSDTSHEPSIQTKTAPVVAMLGDSTTDQGLPTVVQKQLEQRIKSPLKRPSVINAGKGGDNATSALERLEQDVLAHQPNIVTVSFGLNDTGGRKPEQYGESVKKIVKKMKAAYIKVVLMTSTPFNNKRHFWAKREEFIKLGGLDEYMDREFCERMRTVAKEEGVLLLDLHAIFRSEIAKKTERIDKLISQDGVHLTAEGLNHMAEHIVPVILKILDSKDGRKVK